MKLSTVILLTSILAFLSGCSFNGCPRPRLGSYATDTPGTNFINPNNLNTHHFANCLYEGNGIVYTCRGGHIDIAHLRIAADYTKYLSEMIKQNLSENGTAFSYKLNVEPSVYTAHIEYPLYWDNTSPQSKRIIDKISIDLAEYMAFNMTTWHEILTWYGYKCMGFVTETPSAFSWEDIYSNLLGTRLAAMALADSDRSYDDAMTAAISSQLEYLGIQSSATAREAASQMRGDWYDGTLIVEMKCRNMDTGIDDGFVTPTLIPEVSQCPDATAQSYPAPNLNTLLKYGFKINIEIEPREFEKDRILKIIYPDGNGTKIDLISHLPLILEEVKKEAIAKGYTVMPY